MNKDEEIKKLKEENKHSSNVIIALSLCLLLASIVIFMLL